MVYLFVAVYGLVNRGDWLYNLPVTDCFGLKGHGAIFGLIKFAIDIGGAFI